MTSFDIICLLILGISTLWGLWRGFISELFGLIGWVLGIIGAVEIGIAVGNALPMEAGPLRNMAGGAIVFFTTIFLIAIVRICFKSVLKKLGLGPFDHILGMVFGIVRGSAIIVFAVLIMRFTSLPEQEWWKQSNFTRPSAAVVDKLLKHMPMAWYRKLNYYVGKTMNVYDNADPSIMQSIKQKAEEHKQMLDYFSGIKENADDFERDGG